MSEPRPDILRASQPAIFEVRTNQAALDEIQDIARDLGVTSNAIGRLAVDRFLAKLEPMVKVGPDRVDPYNPIRFVGMLEHRPVLKGPEGIQRATADVILFTPERNDIVRITTHFDSRLVERIANAKGNDYVSVVGHLSAERFRHPSETDSRLRYTLLAEGCSILDGPTDIMAMASPSFEEALNKADQNAPTEVKVLPSSNVPVRI